MNMASYQNFKIYKITHASCTKCYIVSEAHAQRYLKECQGLELQKVQVLIPTTSTRNAHCKVQFLEFHPSDNREDKYFSKKHTYEEYVPAPSGELRSCFPLFLLREGPLDVHVVP